MAPRTRLGPGRRTRWARLALALVVVPLGALGATTAVAAQEPAAATTPELGPVLEGEAPGLRATATTGTDGSRTMTVDVEIVNTSGATRQVAVPFGMLLATDDSADQTTAVGGPKDDSELASIARSGGTPTVVATPGTSSHTFVVYCSEADDTFPLEPTPMSYVGMAGDPLPRVLRNIAAQQPSNTVAQDAVWWVTDGATLPVPDHVRPLLDGVDVEAFARAPRRVVPDTGYDPRWARDAEQAGPLYRAEDEERAAGIRAEEFDSGRSDIRVGGDSGPGIAPILWMVAVGIAAAGLIGVAVRQANRS